jgi:hypothetical protein
LSHLNERKTYIMQRQRNLNSSVPKIGKPNIARDGSSKNIVDAPVKAGMVRQTKGDLHPWLHGVSVDDTPDTGIIKSHEKPIGFHSGNTDQQIIKSVHGGQVLDSASRLGRQPEEE